MSVGVNGFLAGLQRFGIGRLAAVIGGAAGVAAVLAALVFHIGGEPQSLLYSGLDLREASEITAALEQGGVPHETRGDGSTIMVPRDRVGSTRLMLAGRGLPTSSSVGYELFDEGSALGQTDFVQNINRQRALEGELARNIRSLQGVTSAQVRLVMPRRQLFEESAEQPSASVIVGTTRGDLDAERTRALRNFVAGAVPGLTPARVTVLDSRGRMLAGGENDASGAAGLGDNVRQETEARLRGRILQLVEGIVGPGNARVDVSAELNMNRVTRQQEEFNPDGQVVRSQTTSENTEAETSAANTGAVSASENVPGAAGQAAGAAQNGSQSRGQNETINYEISRTTTTEVEEPGQISRVSVAVAVNGVASTANGRTTFTPRSPQEIQRIEQLVRAAIGFNAERQDLVQVVPVQFQQEAAPEGGEAGLMSSFDKNDLMRGIELLVLVIVGGMIVFFVVRPLFRSLNAPAAGAGGLAIAMAGAGAAGAAALPGPAAVAQIAVDPATGQPLALPSPTMLPSEIEQRIDMAKVEGQVKASSVRRVAEFVDRHPDESVAILRSWLHES